MLPHLAGDSGFYDSTFSGPNPSNNAELLANNIPPHQLIDGRLSSKIQESVSDQLAKWDKWLHEFYVTSERKMPDDSQLLHFCVLIRVPEHAIRARFKQYYDMDNYPLESFSYSNDGNQANLLPLKPKKSIPPALPHPPIVSSDQPARLVELPEGEPDLPRSLNVEVETVTGDARNSNGIAPDATWPERVVLTPSFVSLIMSLVRLRGTTGCGNRSIQ